MLAIVVCVDVFPDGNQVLGGAPFNLAWHLQAFAQHPCFISRVGDDGPGETVRSAMFNWGMETRFLQTDPDRPTGRVEVQFERGEPHYDIVADCAYDFIAAQGLEDVTCRILCHGSLAIRNKVSRETLNRLKTAQPDKVFLDVNLRAPWWERERVLALIDAAHWVKMNDHELKLLFDGTGTLEAMAQDFRAVHELEVLVVTCAEEGAIAVRAGGPPIHIAPSRKIHVVDTVGAGDAFSAVLVLGLAKGWPMALTMERAQSFASLLVERQGATVQEIGFYQPLIEAWQ